MSLMHEIIFGSVAADAAAIILIVAALPMAGWSWMVNNMPGYPGKKSKEDT